MTNLINWATAGEGALAPQGRPACLTLNLRPTFAASTERNGSRATAYTLHLIAHLIVQLAPFDQPESKGRRDRCPINHSKAATNSNHL